MLCAISIINLAKAAAGVRGSLVVVDVHRLLPVSLEVDLSFMDIKAVGALLQRRGELHAILDSMFMVSREIP